MLKIRYIKIIVLAITFVIINLDFLKIKITTVDVYDDPVLISYLKEKNTSIFNELEKIKLICKCFIVYEKGVSESIRFKIYGFGNSNEQYYIFSSILKGFRNIIQSEDISYNQKIDSVYRLFERVLNQGKIDIKLSDKRYVEELIKNALRDSQLQSFRINYLQEKYDDISNFNYNIYQKEYPSNQLSIIFNILIFLIAFFYLRND